MKNSIGHNFWTIGDCDPLQVLDAIFFFLKWKKALWLFFMVILLVFTIFFV